MYTSTITPKGQITIPMDLRHQLGLQPGDKVTFHVKDDKIILTKQKNDIPWAGILQVNKRVSLQDIEKAIAQGFLDDPS